MYYIYLSSREEEDETLRLRARPLEDLCPELHVMDIQFQRYESRPAFVDSLCHIFQTGNDHVSIPSKLSCLDAPIGVILDDEALDLVIRK
jgi:hypothetical protein